MNEHLFLFSENPFNRFILFEASISIFSQNFEFIVVLLSYYLPYVILVSITGARVHPLPALFCHLSAVDVVTFPRNSVFCRTLTSSGHFDHFFPTLHLVLRLVPVSLRQNNAVAACLLLKPSDRMRWTEHMGISSRPGTPRYPRAIRSPTTMPTRST